MNKVETEKGVPGHENRKPPVAFLDSLLLGEVNFVKQTIKRKKIEYQVVVC